MKNYFGKFGLFVLAAIVLVSGIGLFFEDQFARLASFISYDRIEKNDSGELFRIAYMFAPEDLNPFSNNPAVKTRLLDVYETLVRPDGNLNMEPLLAISYGRVSEKLWNFKLRKDVLFHNGKNFSSRDVIFSFNQAAARPGNCASELIDSIESIHAVNDHEIMIYTRLPDPLLLVKLSSLNIIPEGFDDFDNPVGTGPYMIYNSENLEQIKYSRFNKYWGNKPFFSRVEVLAQMDKTLRVDGLLKGEFDFLADVPPEAVPEIENADFNIEMMPSLEVGFALFNMLDKNFIQKSLRKAIVKAIDVDGFVDKTFGYVSKINQFIPSGVFGYNPDLATASHDNVVAKELIDEFSVGFENLSLDFYFPQNLRLLGQYFSEQLLPIGVDLKLHPLSDLELRERFLAGKLGFYYLGWKHDSGDALPFLKAVLHTRDGRNGYGVYNGSFYTNKEVDFLIERSETNLNESERLADLQEVMRLAIQEDFVGLPLFESMSIFAYAPNIEFTPRVDSLIFPSLISKSNL